MLKMIRALKELQKKGGMPLCKPCLIRKIKGRTSDPAAVERSLESGLYKPAPDGKKCFLCDNDADYFVSLKDSMSAIHKTSKMR
jgi:hypothetical protein